MPSKRFTFGILLSLFSLGACGSAPDAASELKLTNGITISEAEYPAVVLIMNPQAADHKPSFCTAVFVNDHQALTAAHCVGDRSLGAQNIYLMHPEWDSAAQSTLRPKAQALRVHVHPQYHESAAGDLSAHDLAVLDFPSGTAAASLKLAEQSPTVNARITLIGYGAHENHKAGTQSSSTPSFKRYGSNSVKSCTQGLLSLSGLTRSRGSFPLGKQVGTAAGDSGSPWLADGKLTSITVGSKIQQQSQSQHLNLTYAVDLNSSSSRAFLQEFLN